MLNVNKSSVKINLAVEYAQKALKIDQANGFAYATLAEAYAMMTNDEGFYKNLEMALKYGFPFWEQLEEPCFEKYMRQERLKTLISQYKSSF